MAFNWNTFRTRALTAIIFAGVMVAGLLWNQWSFFVLFSIIHFGCWIEYQELVSKIDPGYQEITPFHRYGVMIGGWCLMLWFSHTLHFFGIGIHELGWWVGLIVAFMLPVCELLFAKNIRLKNIGHSFFGLIYISLAWGLMMDLYRIRDVQVGDSFYPIDARIIPIIIVAAIWINDTMAYIVGSLIGKHPLSKISPKKTWEGTIGGMILAIVVSGLISYYLLDYGVLTIHIAVIATIASIFGTLGDLLESKLKRLAGVKDSGSFMPGHGGFLDRFDSLLLATPFVWLYVNIVM